MTSIDKIKAPIKKEMKDFNPFFGSLMKGKAPLLNIITNYILKTKGKQMRPMFVFLSAKLNGEVTKSTFHAASLIELMHTATLVHDDVVDEAYKRRSFFSINALWKNKISVLFGDYLLAKGLLLAVDNNEHELLRIVSIATREMAEGELLQIEKARKLDITEEVYFEVIRKKTATLIAACAASGAQSVGVNADAVEKMRNFGELVGIAFQIKDDLLDYDTNGLTGKASGNDIKERKMTLPLIHSLNSTDKSEKKRILRLVKRHNTKSKKVKEIIDFVVNNGGIEYSHNKMNEYKSKALEILNEFPASESRDSLQELVIYTTERKK
jgi:octaprenyl-diphosphate synthase